MRLSEFILLGHEEKKIAILHLGILVAKRKDSTAMRFLFQVEGFYVEASFHPEQKGIESFNMFDHSSMLEPYLESISLDDLLN